MAQTARINRHRRSVEIEVMPCTDYYFKVIASEDWKGLRDDFKVFSEVVASGIKMSKIFNPPAAASIEEELFIGNILKSNIYPPLIESKVNVLLVCRKELVFGCLRTQILASPPIQNGPVIHQLCSAVIPVVDVAISKLQPFLFVILVQVTDPKVDGEIFHAFPADCPNRGSCQGH